MGNPAGDIKQAHLVVVGPIDPDVVNTVLSIPSGAGVIHAAISVIRTFIVPETARSETEQRQAMVVDGVEILSPGDIPFDVELIRRHGVESRVNDDPPPTNTAGGVESMTRMTFQNLPYHGLRFSTSFLWTIAIFLGISVQQNLEAKIWYTEDI